MSSGEGELSGNVNIKLFPLKSSFSILKDRQQVITAVLPRLQLNAHCEFAPKPLYY